MPLTDTECRTAKPKEKPYKLTDGNGLYLEVKPNGVKAWRYRFELNCGFHAIRPPSPLSSGQAFHGHLATCSTAIRPGSRSAATQGLHC